MKRLEVSEVEAAAVVAIRIQPTPIARGRPEISMTTYPSKYDYLCLDCSLPFEEGEARNASLVEFEFNVACPSCGSDNIKELKKDE